MRMRIRLVEKLIFEGGVASPAALDASFLEEIFVVGERLGHLPAFINLIRNSNSFTSAHKLYKDISIPVLLIYGEQDWSKQNERSQTGSEIPDVSVETVANAGHFLSLEHPQLLNEKIVGFSQTL